MAKKVETRGRPSTGVRQGERVSEYPVLLTRLPKPMVVKMKAAAKREGIPLWRWIHDVIGSHLAAEKRNAA